MTQVGPQPSDTSFGGVFHSSEAVSQLLHRRGDCCPTVLSLVGSKFSGLPTGCPDDKPLAAYAAHADYHCLAFERFQSLLEVCAMSFRRFSVPTTASGCAHLVLSFSLRSTS